MANKDYEQKKRECLQEFCKLHDCETPHDYIAETFSYAFDRAYALGKQTEAISQEEIEKAAEEYVLTRQQARHNVKKEEDATMRDFDKTIKAWDAYDMEQAFESGANLYICKQEKDADTSLWNRLTDEEKREMQCRYHTNECVLSDHKKRTGDKAQSKDVARMKLLENLFGKENLKINDNE